MSPLAQKFVILIATLLLVSCSSAPTIAPPAQWSFAKGAVRLRLTGDQQLNLFHDSPHALVSCLYQLRDPSAFTQMADEPGGLEKLLQCSRFDASVATAKRLVIQPKQSLEESMDRAEGARYLGYVAGYFHLHREKVLRLVTVPVVETSSGFLWRRKVTAAPASIMVDLHLNAQEIAEVTTRAESAETDSGRGGAQ